MNSVSRFNTLFLVAAMVFAGNAFAVKPNEEEPKECKKPKFRDFVPEHKAEVAPESEVSFHVSKGTLLTSITAEAHGVPMEVEAVNRKTFIMVKTRLPASVREGYARIHVTARAEEGDCLGQDGWLIKISETAPVATPVVTDQAETDRTVENSQ